MSAAAGRGESDGMAPKPTTNRPTQAPRPDQSYERADPNGEAGMGDLDKDQHTPTDRDDAHEHAAAQKPDGTPLKTDSTENLGRPSKPVVPEERIEGDMTTEEPLGWDQAPQDIKNPTQKRHPRTEGKGGVV